MFQIVRHWWTGGRGKVTLRLFAFEFVVVVLGVLVAQALADWNQNRIAAGRLESFRDEQFASARFAFADALAWKKAIPCLDQRMGDIMRYASGSGGSLGAASERPRFARPVFVRPDEDLRVALHNADPDIQDKLQRLSNLSTNLADRAGKITEEWGGLAMVDPAYGALSPADRTEARHSASRVKVLLQSMAGDVKGLVDTASSLPVEPDWAGRRAIRDCDDMWRSGSMHPMTDS